jgi:hypothetical protein
VIRHDGTPGNTEVDPNTLRRSCVTASEQIVASADEQSAMRRGPTMPAAMRAMFRYS